MPPPWEFDEPSLPAVATIAAAHATIVAGESRDFLGRVSIDSAQLRSGTPGVRLTIAGEKYELQPFDEKNDPRYGMRHVTLRAIDRENSYARFSVDDRNGLVYGAIYTPDRSIAIVPAQRKGYQDVFLSRPDPASAPPSRSPETTSPALRTLVWRHHELEAVAAIKPHYADVRYEWRTALILGGDLGRLHRADAREFVQLAVRLADITQFTGAETFQIAEATTPNAGGQQLSLHQLVDGIPVLAHNYVLTDRSGKVLQFSTALVASNFAPIRPVFSRTQAWDRVVAQWPAVESRELEAEASSLKATLQYQPVTSMNDLELIYEFRFTASATPYLARVNAVDGTTEIARLEAH